MGVEHAKRIGITLLVGLIIVLLSPVLAVVVLVGSTLGVALYVGDQWRKRRACHRFWAEWGSQGKDLLLVYSNSPHWQRYVESTWLPRWEHRAIVLNWSERRQWNRTRAEVALYRAFAGRREFNPLAIVVTAGSRRPTVVRFWRAFKDHKHGKDGRLKEAEAELERHLAPVRQVDKVGQATSKR